MAKKKKTNAPTYKEYNHNKPVWEGITATSAPTAPDSYRKTAYNNSRFNQVGKPTNAPTYQEYNHNLPTNMTYTSNLPTAPEEYRKALEQMKLANNSIKPTNAPTYTDYNHNVPQNRSVISTSAPTAPVEYQRTFKDNQTIYDKPTSAPTYTDYNHNIPTVKEEQPKPNQGGGNGTGGTGSGGSTNQDNSGTSESAKNNAWKQYQNMLNVNKANLQAELGAVNQVANATLDTYRKQLGLAGSGAGESVGLQNNLNYLNAVAQANLGAQQAQQDFRAQESERFANLYQQALESGNYQAVRDLEKQYEGYEGLTPGTLEYLKATGNIAGIWETDKQNKLEDLSVQIDNNKELSDNQREELSKIYTEINNAKNQNQYDELLLKYKEALENPENVSGEVELPTDYLEEVKYIINDPSIKEDETILSSTGYDSKYIDRNHLGSFYGSGTGGKQDDFTKSILDATDAGKFKEGTIVDFNYGVGQSLYILLDGKWTYITPARRNKIINLKGSKIYSSDTRRELSKMGINFK